MASHFSKHYLYALTPIVHRNNCPMPLISLHQACIKNRNKTLFRDLSFCIEKGQNWAIVGPAGSGKTALLKAIAGEYFVAKGSLVHHYYHEYRAKHPIPDPLFSHRHLISFVDVKHHFTNLCHTRDFFYQQRFNASYADASQTVEEHLREIAASTRLEGPWTLERIVRVFNLEALRDKHLIKLSNGETRRLRIAAALLKNPVVLLLDNPLTGLDIHTRKYFDTLFDDITQSGITIIMVTDPRYLPKAITHVLAIDPKGQVKAMSEATFNPEMVDLNASSWALPSLQKLPKLPDHAHANPYKTLVSMTNVKVTYGHTKILEGINWTIKPGERWALSGPNGSGKSTLLSLIYGDHPQAYSNDIVLFDRPRGTGESIWDIKQNIGYMSPELFQYFPDQYPCHQVVESGFYDTVGLYQEVNEATRRKSIQWMEVMGIAEIQNTPFGEVASTLQRLCLLTRALVKNPPLLILDEPCQEFDPSQQRYFRSLIDTIFKQSHLSMIYVTHHQEELPACITHKLKL